MCLYVEFTEFIYMLYMKPKGHARSAFVHIYETLEEN